MIKLSLLAIAAASLAFAGPVLAEDGPISTAAKTTDANIAAFLDPKAHPLDASDEVQFDEPQPIQPDRKVHGEFGVAVGTGGYRSAYGVIQAPIGKTGMATIAVETGRSQWLAPAWPAGPYLAPADFRVLAP